MRQLDLAQFGGLTQRLKEQVATAKNADSVNARAIAAAGEAIRRRWNIDLRDQHLAAAAALHAGHVVQVNDRVGRLLVPPIGAYVAAVFGEHVHVMTANASTANARATELQPLFGLLGLTVGSLSSAADPADCARDYRATVVYGSYEQFGYDHLRDNLAWKQDELVQLNRDRAILEEADWILIDQALVPLIVNGPTEPDLEQYRRAADAASALRSGMHYSLEEHTGKVELSPEGTRIAGRAVGVDLTQPSHAIIRRALQDAIRARVWYRDGIDYSVSNGMITTGAAHSGRLRDDARFAKGARQALETRLGLHVTDVEVELARITVLDFLRKYRRISGVSPTAGLAADELDALYRLSVAASSARRSSHASQPDRLFRSTVDRDSAIAADAARLTAAGQKVLVGAPTRGDAARISRALGKHRVPHLLVDIAHQAGANVDSTLVLATEVRGVDPWPLRLEDRSDPSVAVVGAGRSQSRRADQWLVSLASGGESGGERSQFFLSRDDPLQRALQSKSYDRFPKWVGDRRNGQTVGRLYARLTDAAQQEAAKRALTAKQHMIEFDRVEKSHRENIYAAREQVIAGHGAEGVIVRALDRVGEYHTRAQHDPVALGDALTGVYETRLTIADLSAANTPEDRERLVKEDIHRQYKARKDAHSAKEMLEVERQVALAVFDLRWREYIAGLDAARDAIAETHRTFDEILHAYHIGADQLFREMQLQVSQDLARHILSIDV